MHFGLDIDVGSLPPLFGGELQEVNSDDSVNIALPKLQRGTDSASTPASKFLSDYIIAEVENNGNRTDESVLKADFCNTLDKICQEEHHQNCEELSKQSLENVLEFQGRVDEDFIKEKVSDIDINIASLLFEGELLDTNSGGDPVNIALPKLQRETDSTGTPASKLLSENNSSRIDKSILKEEFYNTLDKMCQEEHHQNFEELSKQSLKKALEFQGRVYRNFTKKKAKLSKQQLVSNDRFEYPCIVTDCPYTHINRGDVKKHLFKHIKVSQHYCEQCLPDKFFARDKTVLNRHIRLKHSTDSTLSKYGAKRIDENALKTAFYNTLDKICQEKHHQNFEELSKQSLKNALEFQGRVYRDFTKKKAKLSKKQLVSTDRYEYPCIVTDCSFTHINRVDVKMHLFKHIKVSQYYCEQCLPHTFFVRDTANLNRHKRSVHFLDKVISKRGIKRMHQPVQNTMNGSSGFTVNQESGSCLLLNSAKRAKTDP